MSFSLPCAGSQAYLNAFGVVAIFIARKAAGSHVVGISRNLGRTARRLRAEITTVFWVHAERDAHRLVGALDRDAAPGVKALRDLAEQLAIPLGDHATTLARVDTARRRIAAAVDGLRTSGGLSTFNRSYRDQRRLAAQEGRSYPSYGQALSQLQKRAVTNYGAYSEMHEIHAGGRQPHMVGRIAR
jgi:hypothetical protein